MNPDQFKKLVARLEAEAAVKPRQYRCRVAALAALGYGYIVVVLAGLTLGVGILLVLCAAKPNILFFKALAVVAGTLIVAWRALWVTLPPPTGIALTRAQVPELFAMLDEVGATLRCRPFDRVLLTDDFNAAVCQLPRLGFLGWYFSFLILGLPMMQALSPDQFRAVIAHEMGHLSANHSRFSVWVYRVRRSWMQLLEQIERRRVWGSRLFTSFLGWFAPYFNAYSFVLARQSEYEADASAVQVAGANVSAQALIQVELRGRQLEQALWPALGQQARQDPEPPSRLFESFGAHLRSPLPAEAAQTWFHQALNAETGIANTHPALKDRLAAIGALGAGCGEPVELPERPDALPQAEGPSAAERFLGAAAAEYAMTMGARWSDQVRSQWQQRFLQGQAMVKSLAAIEAKVEHCPLTVEESWTRAVYTAELHGDAAAEPILESVLTLQPEHAGANLRLGRLHIDRGDPRGVGLLETAMQADIELVPACSELLHRFHQERGNQEHLEALEQKFEAYRGFMQRVANERQSVSADDKLLGHGLDADALERIRSWLATEPRIGSAYLVRKAVRLLPHRPLFVLGVQPHYPWYKPRPEDSDQHLAEALVQSTPLAEVCIVVFNSTVKGLANNIRGVEGAEIYRRSS